MPVGGGGSTACGGTADGPEGKESVPPQPASPTRSTKRGIPTSLLQNMPSTSRRRRLRINLFAELMMMSGLRVRGCAVLYRHGDARYGDCQSAKSPGHKRRIRSCRPSVSLSKQPVTSVNATRVGLQEAMRRLDASRCKPVASEGSVERAPHRNENDENTTQGLVKKNGTQR